MADWYYMKNGQQCGPVDTAALKHLAETGQLQPADLIWREGMPNSIPASQQRDLFEGGVPTAPAGQACPQGSAAATPVTPLMVQHLLATRRWVLFLSIVAFIGFSLVLVLGVVMVVLCGMGGRRDPRFLHPVAIRVLVYLVPPVLYAAPAWLLYRYAGAIGRYRHSGSSGDMEAALGRQKSLWGCMGIVGIVAIVVMAILVGLHLIAMVVQ